jgi:hypothetical protein
MPLYTVGSYLTLHSNIMSWSQQTNNIFPSFSNTLCYVTCDVTCAVPWMPYFSRVYCLISYIWWAIGEACSPLNPVHFILYEVISVMDCCILQQIQSNSEGRSGSCDEYGQVLEVGAGWQG